MVSQGPALARSAQELLAEFVQTGQQRPFEEIVRRYAGMVFNVCYQILRDTHDAEDATQAVFLTLAVKAKTENGIKYLAPWLQKVAQRLSLDVRRSKSRRKVREERHSVMQQMNSGDGDTSRNVDLDEVKVLLRDELDKLPAKYRLPLILHYFGGLKPEEMARELGCKPSTLGVRLHRGRKLLAENLAGRGVTVGASLLGVMLASVIQGSVHEHLIHNSSYAATRFAAHGYSAGVSARVIGFNRLAEQGLLMAKIKSAVAAAAMLATAAAGAAEFVARVKPLGLDFNLPGQIRMLFDPIIRSFSHPLHLPRVATNTMPTPPTPAALPTQANVVVASNDATKNFTLSIPPTAVPISPQAAHTASTNGGGADHANSSQPAASSATDIATSSPISPLSLPQPTIHWPTPTPSSNSGALVAVGDGSTTSSTSTTTSQSQPAASSLVASDDSITIGGGGGSSKIVTWSGPGPLTVRNFTVASNGLAAFHQTGGQIQTQHLSIGEDAGSNGTYTMTGNSSLQAGSIDVGGAGTGHLLVASADATLNATDIYLGRDAGSTGYVDLDAGKITDNMIAVGDKGDGVFTQVGGNHTIAGNAVVSSAAVPMLSTHRASSGLLIALANGSEGIYNLKGGNVHAAKEVIGANSLATLKQSGGSNQTSSVLLGAGAGSNGTYKLDGGSVEIQRSPSRTGPSVASTPTGVVIGNAGTGALAIGDADASGTILESGTGAPVSLTVRQTSAAQGRLYGWGDVDLGGTLNQNGEVIADGYGQPRDLNLASFSQIVNTIDNPPGSDNGYFARHGGRLVMPPLKITGTNTTVTWGENTNDAELDLINAARFSFSGVQDPGTASVDLLAADRSDIPTAPAGVQFASVWQGDFDKLKAASIGVTVRYDDSFSPGFAAGNVELWTFNNGNWQQATSNVNLDVTDRLISATVSPTDWFAVSTLSNGAIFPQALAGVPLDGAIASVPANLGVEVPEPASIGLIALTALTVIPRRRRRKM